jgi:hypothetical protein
VLCIVGPVTRVAHRGEPTEFEPFEMVDAALAETDPMQKRVRDLPSRMVVYIEAARRFRAPGL